MKKFVALLLAMMMLAMPLFSTAETVEAAETPVDALTAQLMSHPVVTGLLQALMNGKALIVTENFAVEGAEAYAEVEGIGPYVTMAADLLNSLSATCAIQLTPFMGAVSIGMNGTEIIDATAEVGADSVYVGSTALMGDSVIALSFAKLQELAAQAAPTQLDPSSLNFENTQAFLEGLQDVLAVEAVEVTEQPEDADPAVSAASVTVPEDFFPQFAEALAADLKANEEALSQIGMALTDEKLAEMKENFGKMKIETMIIYMGEDGEPVAIDMALTDGEEAASVKIGFKKAEAPETVTIRVEGSDYALCMKLSATYELTETDINCYSGFNLSMTSGGETHDFDITEVAVLSALEDGDIGGQSVTVVTTSALPGLSLTCTSTLGTAAPMEGLNKEGAADILSMDETAQSEWAQNNIVPNLAGLLFKVIQSAPESVSTVLMSLMNMDISQ
ncbi:MAG: hypothetical protein IKP40_03390 [Clostridia bacterium]|nr:hypothetical protein [Clostridia bacterium]